MEKTDNLIAVVDQVHFSTYYAVKYYLGRNKKIGRVFLVYSKKSEGNLIGADKIDDKLEITLKECGIRFIDKVGISDVHNPRRTVQEFENLVAKRLLQGKTRIIYDPSYLSVHLYRFFSSYENTAFSHYRDLDLIEDESNRLVETF